MARQRGYHKLDLWRKAMDFADEVYTVADQWPRQEDFAMMSQIRRSVLSIPCNVAEGHGRTGPRELLHHLSIAYGSLNETETLREFGLRRGYVDEPTLDRLMDLSGEIGKLALGLMRSLQRAAAQS